MRLQLDTDTGDRDEDWWYLVFDRNGNDLYVDHRWKRLKLKTLEDKSGNERIELSDFLTQHAGSAAHVELVSALVTMFKDNRNA